MLVVIGVETVEPRHLTLACIMVIFGTVFDLLDGRVARMTNRFTEFGVQLDSLADLVSFGVAPALLAYAWVLNELGAIGIAICAWYIVCAAFRLARFNVNTSYKVWQLKGHSQGVTSTMAGFCVVAMIWMFNGCLLDVVQVPTVLVAGVVASMGLLMLSSVPFRNFRDIRNNKRARLLFALGLAIVLTAAVVIDASMLFGAAAFVYVTIGLVDGAITAVHFRRIGMPLPDDLLGDDTDEVELHSS